VMDTHRFLSDEQLKTFAWEVDAPH